MGVKCGSKSAKAEKAKVAADKPKVKAAAAATLTMGELHFDKHVEMSCHLACSQKCVSLCNVGCDIRSYIPHEAHWPDCFPLKSTVDLVTSWGLSPESIQSRLVQLVEDSVTAWIV